MKHIHLDPTYNHGPHSLFQNSLHVTSSVIQAITLNHLFSDYTHQVK